MATQTVGIRELKNRLSQHMRAVKAGGELTVTERGRAIARIMPMAEVPEWVAGMLASGEAHWGGGKPKGARIRLRGRGPTAAEVVLQQRG